MPDIPDDNMKAFFDSLKAAFSSLGDGELEKASDILAHRRAKTEADDDFRHKLTSVFELGRQKCTRDDCGAIHDLGEGDQAVLQIRQLCHPGAGVTPVIIDGRMDLDCTLCDETFIGILLYRELNEGEILSRDDELWSNHKASIAGVLASGKIRQVVDKGDIDILLLEGPNGQAADGLGIVIIDRGLERMLYMARRDNQLDLPIIFEGLAAMDPISLGFYLQEAEAQRAKKLQLDPTLGPNEDRGFLVNPETFAEFWDFKKAEIRPEYHQRVDSLLLLHQKGEPLGEFSLDTTIDSIKEKLMEDEALPDGSFAGIIIMINGVEHVINSADIGEGETLESLAVRIRKEHEAKGDADE